MNNPLCTGFEDTSGLSRRSFLNKLGMGLGGLALADMVNPLQALDSSSVMAATHLAPKAKRIIFLFQSGGPSQMDLYDYKPQLNIDHGKELPDSVRKGQRLTGMSTNQSSLPIAGSPFDFAQHGQSGATLSSVLPYTAEMADDICFVKSMYTEAINHGPGVTFMQTGSQVPGRPSFGSWLDYGLGSMNDNLPSYVVLNTKGGKGQPLTSTYWDSGFLPGKHNGVRFRSDKDAVLYLNNPQGISRASRHATIEHLQRLHEKQLRETSDPALETHIAQYEMAFRMQTSVPEVTNMSGEPESVLNMYGDDVKTPGTYAANCLMARRLAERGVRFIQLFHQGWDAHSGLEGSIRKQTKLTDQPSACLLYTSPSPRDRG